MKISHDSREYKQLVKKYPDHIRILAEGDSWFAYPRKYLFVGKDANIIDHLDNTDEFVIYNTSSNGDEMVSMLCGDDKFSLIKKLEHNEFDYLLFSGGGNDIVGKMDFDFFIKKKTAGMSWKECIDTDRVAMKLSLIKSSYEFLCELTKDHSKNPYIKIITHTYDKIIPSNEGFELFDTFALGKSWINPYLVRKGITNVDEKIKIVDYLMTGFKMVLEEVAEKYDNFKVIDTRGCVAGGEWRNEIHPDSEGFKKGAEKIYLEG